LTNPISALAADGSPDIFETRLSAQERAVRAGQPLLLKIEAVNHFNEAIFVNRPVSTSGM
jgi:hypothetical protein